MARLIAREREREREREKDNKYDFETSPSAEVIIDQPISDGHVADSRDVDE